MEARELDKERRRLFGSLQQIEQQLLEAEQNPSKTTTAMQNISGRRKSSMASMRRMPVVGLIRGDSSNPRYFSVAQNKVRPPLARLIWPGWSPSCTATRRTVAPRAPMH